MQEILYDLKVNHTETSPVFVLGHGRSGTSILIKLMRKYLKVNFGTESQFIVRYYKLLPRYGDLKRDSNLKNLLNDISRERWFRRLKKRFGFELDLAETFNAVDERTYSGVLRAVFAQFAAYHQMERWGDKTPEYIYNLPVLLELFPEAKFIHIVRDGRDVALSEFKTQFGAKNIYKAAYDWKQKVGMIHDFCSLLPTDRHCQIRYEDLLNSPAVVFEKLKYFLKIEDPAHNLTTFIKTHIYNDLKRTNFDKWRSKLSSHERLLFEREAGDFLSYYGYEREHGHRELKEIQNLEKAFWLGDNFIRRKLRVNFVRDNFYRGFLRFKDKVVPLRNKLHPQRHQNIKIV